MLAKRGWSVPHWPVEWGGTGWTPMQHYIFASECILAGAPARAPQGPSMVAPVLFKYGTQEQKDKWLPAIRSGTDYWAQGYSEPGSGSDLASLQCRAVREGDEYVINGTKIWTTHAHFANRIFCLVRTSTEGKAQQGISFLCFDIDLPGITIRPIPSLSGDHELNQVFFDDVRVPVSALVGEENDGWTVAKYLLVHERSGLRSPSQRVRLERLMARAKGAFGNRTDAAAQRAADALWTRIARAAAGVDAMQATDLDALDASVAGQEPPLLPSVGKVLGAQGRQLITSLLVEAGGPAMAAGLSQEEAAVLMQVSRPTLCRILAEARSQVARALSRGWAIRIEVDGEHTVTSGNGEENMAPYCQRAQNRADNGRKQQRAGRDTQARPQPDTGYCQK